MERVFHNRFEASEAPRQLVVWALAECERIGIRMTSARRAIVNCLARQSEPVNLAAIQASLDSSTRIDAATVYRTVILLRDASVVRQITLDHKHRLFLLNSTHVSRAYVICQSCGDITPLSPVVAEEKRAQEIARLGYIQVEPHLEFRGLCPRCRSKPGATVPRAKLRVR